MTRPTCSRLLLLCCFALAACAAEPGGERGNRRTGSALVVKELQVALGDARAATIDLDFGCGELRLGSGSQAALLEGVCQYNFDPLRPVLSEGLVDGRLAVGLTSSEPASSLLGGEGVRNEWYFLLNESVPIELDLRARACHASMELGGLQLTGVALRGEESSLEVRFDRPNQGAMDHLEVSLAAGDLSLHRLGNANFQRLSVDGGLGDIALDFSGDWQRSAEVDIDGGLCSVRLYVPRGVPTRLSPSDTVACIAPGFRDEGGSWVNEAWKEGSPVELVIRVNGGLRKLEVIEN